MRFFFHIKTDLHQDQFELLHKFGNDIFGTLLQYVFHILSSNVLCFFHFRTWILFTQGKSPRYLLKYYRLDFK